MFSQSHTFALQCAFICNCLSTFRIRRIRSDIALCCAHEEFLAVEDNADGKVTLLEKLWLSAVDSLFGFCDFLVHPRATPLSYSVKSANPHTTRMSTNSCGVIFLLTFLWCVDSQISQNMRE